MFSHRSLFLPMIHQLHALKIQLHQIMRSFNKLPFKKTQRPSVTGKFLHQNLIVTTFLTSKRLILLCHLLFDKPDLDYRSRLQVGHVTLGYSTIRAGSKMLLLIPPFDEGSDEGSDEGTRFLTSVDVDRRFCLA
jgi:hypothetical protein